MPLMTAQINPLAFLKLDGPPAPCSKDRFSAADGKGVQARVRPSRGHLEPDGYGAMRGADGKDD